MAWDARKRLRFSFPYLVFYACVMMQTPNFLGLIFLRVFGSVETATARAEGEGGMVVMSAEMREAVEASRVPTHAVKLATGVGWMAVMSSFILMLAQARFTISQQCSRSED